MFITVFMIFLAIFLGGVFGKALCAFQTDNEEHIGLKTE